MAGALAADFGLARLLPRFLYGIAAPFSRASVSSNLMAKLVWFVGHPIKDAFSLALAPSSAIFSLAMGLFVGCGLWLSFVGRFKERAFKFGLAVLLLFLAYLPNLIAGENWSSYRTQIALTSLVAVYAVVALFGWLKLIRSDVLFPVIGTITVAAFATCAARNTLLEFAVPQAIEYRLAEAYVRNKQEISDAKRLTIVASPWQATLAPLIAYDEFGVPSSNDIWAARAMLWLILQEHNSPSAALVPSAGLVTGKSVPTDGVTVDFGEALRR